MKLYCAQYEADDSPTGFQTLVFERRKDAVDYAMSSAREAFEDMEPFDIDVYSFDCEISLRTIIRLIQDEGYQRNRKDIGRFSSWWHEEWPLTHGALKRKYPSGKTIVIEARTIDARN